MQDEHEGGPAEATRLAVEANDDNERPDDEKGRDDDVARGTETLPGAGTDEGASLRAAHQAFERGDYREVRRLTAELLEARDGEVARAAGELRTRTGVDPVQILVITVCLVLFLVIAYVYVA